MGEKSHRGKKTRPPLRGEMGDREIKTVAGGGGSAARLNVCVYHPPFTKRALKSVHRFSEERRDVILLILIGE